MSAIVKAVERYKRKILLREQKEMDRMALHWSRIHEDIEASAESLAKHVQRLKKEGEEVSIDMIRREQRYQRLMRQAADREAEFDGYAERLIKSDTKDNINQGIEDAAKVLEDAGVRAGFGDLDVSAVEEMAGLLGDGSPVRDVLQKRFPGRWAKAEQALLNGLAKGQNPRKIAAQIAGKLGAALSDAERIARTEELRAYREASRLAYQESKQVQYYKRHCTHDNRTCIACIMLDGRRYEIKQPLSDHPNGRCSLVPIVGKREPKWQYGPSWFKTLDPEDQQKILGPGKFKAFQEARLDLDNLAQVVHDPIWGETITVRSLKDALL